METQELGLVVYRRTHRLDTPDEQAQGWKAWTAFNSPQTQQDIDGFIRLTSRPGEWLEAYHFKVVPFSEQDAEKVRMLQGLTAGLSPASRRWEGD